MLLLLGSKAVAQPTGAEASAYMAQEKSSGVPLVAPPGFAPEHLSLLYRPRYTLVPPALFGVTKSATAGANAPANTGRGNAPSNAKAANGAYQPLPVQPRSVRSSYDQPPGGRRNADYQSLRLIPALVPLAGSHVPIPAPIVRRGNGAYDAAPPGGRDHGRPLMPAGNYDKVPPGTGRSGSGVQYSSLPADNASGNGAFSSVGSQGSNTSSSFKTETTAGANSGYQALPVHSGNNAALPGSNVSIPPPLVQGGSQRSSTSSSFKTETSAGGNPGYQALPLKSGYESANSGLSSGSSTGTQTSPAKQNTYDKITPQSGSGYENAKSAVGGTGSGGSSGSGSNSGYQTLPVKQINFDRAGSASTSGPTGSGSGKIPAGGYESVNAALNGGSSSGYQTLPVRPNTYGKPAPGRATADYDNIKSLARPATGGGTTSPGSVRGVPLPASKPAAQPVTAKYMPAPKGKPLSPASTGKTNSPAGSGEFKRGVSTTENFKTLPGAGSGSRGAIRLPPVKQSETEAAKKAKEASTKRELQRKLGAKKPGRK